MSALSQFGAAEECRVVSFCVEDPDRCTDAPLISPAADTYTNACSEKAFTHVSCFLQACEIVHRWAAESGLWRAVCKYFTVYLLGIKAVKPHKILTSSRRVMYYFVGLFNFKKLFGLREKLQKAVNICSHLLSLSLNISLENTSMISSCYWLSLFYIRTT